MTFNIWCMICFITVAIMALAGLILLWWNPKDKRTTKGGAHMYHYSEVINGMDKDKKAHHVNKKRK